MTFVWPLPYLALTLLNLTRVQRSSEKMTLPWAWQMCPCPIHPYSKIKNLWHGLKQMQQMFQKIDFGAEGRLFQSDKKMPPCTFQRRNLWKLGSCNNSQVWNGRQIKITFSSIPEIRGMMGGGERFTLYSKLILTLFYFFLVWYNNKIRKIYSFAHC